MQIKISNKWSEYFPGKLKIGAQSHYGGNQQQRDSTNRRHTRNDSSEKVSGVRLVKRLVNCSGEKQLRSLCVWKNSYREKQTEEYWKFN
ncbi:hypothetical protein CEXT_561511 [Caerostris extrusa]|uniref:Uncharacterized protein n=1 Tax=Caerostris extrusa TaxID=172846 RepID=A0AAV4TN65_CAEEX|nr:hypothetical protein CEXT_561511 [Caerostris extrusa]